jgi:hypothetical protein
MAKPSMGFVQFFLEKHCVTSLITPYVFNFMIHLKTFYPPPPQLDVTTKGRCEAIVHDI